MARTTRASRGQLAGLARQVQRQLSPVIASGVREAGLQIVNELAQAGPAWSGKFSASWDVVPEGVAGKERESTGSVYRYTRSNFPLKRFEDALNSRQGSDTVRFSIVNTAPHASIALDQEEGIFVRIGEPIKPLVREGFRPWDGESQDLHFRWQVGDAFTSRPPNAGITAEKDWFQSYVSAGLQRALGAGVSRGFSFPQIT